MAQSKKIHIGLPYRKPAVESDLAIAIAQSVRFKNIRNYKLQKIAFMLKLAAVVCKKSLCESLEVIEGEIRRKLTTITVEGIARHVTKKTLSCNFISALRALHSFCDFLLCLLVKITVH